MRRFLTLVCLLVVAIPAGISISGCTRNPDANYCNGLGYGLLITNVANIFLTPQTTGISIAFGQTQQIASPSAKTCKGTTATVATYTYGTTNNQLVDVSPTGNMCAGTWNRNSGGGIPNFTICSFPNPLPATGNLPYGVAYITASADSVTSNPVEVFVHPQVTSLTLAGPTSCLSQGTLYGQPLDVQACFVGANNAQQLLCAPPSITGAASPNLACPVAAGQSLASVPDCTATIGSLTYNVGTAAVASINTETNQITAEQPGTTVITAQVGQGASSAGYFSTCPPASINVTLANGTTSGTITQGVQQDLTTTVTDTTGNTITGLALNYQSTDPIDITVGAGGAVTAAFPGVGSVNAICQPPACNPAPINQTGLNGTGLSISSNPATITTPGTASDFVWFGAPGQSQYFVPIELTSGAAASTVRLPFVPNSMLMDRTGNNLYFGSQHELMYYSTVSNTITKQDTTVPGVVLAVSPNNSQLLINDQIRQVFYLYTVSGGTSQTFGGMGTSAAWTPDGMTLYVTDTAASGAGHSNTVYVYNVNTGWTTCSTGMPCAANFAGAANETVTIPGVGAYFSGNPTVARTWCPSGTVGNAANIIFYPQGDVVATQTDVLTATTSGMHILGAALQGGAVTLSDIGVTIPSNTLANGQVTPAACPQTTSAAGVTTMLPLTISHTLAQVPIPGVNATSLSQVVASPQSELAFITYNGTTAGAQLPYYIPGTGTTVGSVVLGGSAAASITAPLTGVFSPDGTMFFVSTAGDNLVHFISVPPSVTPSTPPADTQQIAPNLPACTPGSDPDCIFTNTTLPASGIVPATTILVKPRSTT
jgi:trimeric autotransporter adhesin